MITRFMIILMIFYARAQGECTTNDNSPSSETIHNKMKKWSIYNKNFNISDGSSNYQIGVCAAMGSRNATNIGIIQVENQTIYHLGQVEHVRLVETANWTLLTYVHGDPFEDGCENQPRSASIMFVCGTNPKSIKVLQQHTSKDKSCHYMFQMEVAEICSNTPQAKKGMSGGAIFLIILLSVVSAYLIGGILFMRIKRGARGIDQIPNLDLWQKLGHLSADGCDFCCRCNTNSSRAGYFLDESGPDLRGDDDILSP